LADHLAGDDGATVANEVELKNPDEDVGVQIIRETAGRTGDGAGDGATTSTLPAYALLREAVRK